MRLSVFATSILGIIPDGFACLLEDSLQRMAPLLKQLAEDDLLCQHRKRYHHQRRRMNRKTRWVLDQGQA